MEKIRKAVIYMKEGMQLSSADWAAMMNPIPGSENPNKAAQPESTQRTEVQPNHVDAVALMHPNPNQPMSKKQ